MFNQNNEEKKLDWMYKGPNSLVEREEYLLGRSVDKTLEQLNEEEKQKQQGIVLTPKNRVEHECIPPSIRDFNKVVQAEQVDLSAKLQEDPLVAIKKREEESRRQFLQNPVQLKKLQKALKAQQAKKNKKKRKKLKHSDDSESDLDVKLTAKLLGKKSKKSSKEERDLDTILIHKYEEFKDKLTESDLQDILNGKITDTDDSSDEDDKPRKKSRRKKHESTSESETTEKRIPNSVKYHRKDERRANRKYVSSDDDDFKKWKESERHRHSSRNNEDYRRRGTSNHKSTHRNRSRSPQHKSSDRNRRKRESSSDSTNSDHEKIKTSHYSKNYDSDDSDSSRNKRVNYGLVSSDGVKIPFTKRYDSDRKDDKYKPPKASEPTPQVQKHRAKKLTEEEKEKLRQEMMENAVWRDKERSRNLRKYREKEEKERREQDFDPEFIHKQLLKSAHSSSVESRIKANLNNIQRSSRDMDKHFSRRQ
ncbi:pre-mRNA-splicing factor CWC25 -like protein [Asbolus verrucosus]|uniref:Pre-mRNA-splicing factor CWC25-like protein n=1 Tax=Asbolus verrucosus TaxID=1661398 RepID=A0A482WCM6_ASBVE|nr:pre-mRNA-splicing factor CWC25 -like protein [Asbolus verrucosus]